MSTELIEVEHTLDHSPDHVWRIISDPELYPRFADVIAACGRTGTANGGRRARYAVTFSVDGAKPVLDEVEILVHRPPEHLVLVSPRWEGGHLAIRLDPDDRGRTIVQVTLRRRPRPRLRAALRRLRRAPPRNASGGRRPAALRARPPGAVLRAQGRVL